MILKSVLFFVNLILQLLHTMKTRILYLSLFLYSISAISFSQTSDSSLTTAEREDSIVNILNTRNGARIVKPVTTGTEISGFFYYKAYPWVETYGVSLAIYAGHAFSFDKMIESFVDYSPLFHTYNEKPLDFKYSDTFIFFAPGISLYSINRKYSLDLYKKLETQIYYNGKQHIAPLKVNFHF
jgi:hypothetical protein